MKNVSAFHDYDIRGIYKTDIDEQFFYLLGRAVATYIGAGPIAVGYDMRLSSPSLATSLTSGIVDQGVDVVSLGMISTEMNYFASAKYDFAANVIVSASHNPPNYNGAKIVKHGVVPLHGGFGLNEIKLLVESETFPVAEKKGIVSYKNIFNDWIEHTLTFVDQSKLKPLKIVVDGGNGMGGPSWVEIMKRLTMLDFIPLYVDPDGNFPHHLADPLKDENTIDLKNTLLSKQADLGIALDGDADRIFFMDEKGNKLSGTVTSAILAEYFLKKGAKKILYSAICGRIIKETVEKYGAIAIRTRVGHSLIKEKMRETSAEFAGEHSGHFYFGSNFAAESSLIAGLLMIEILSETGKNLSKLNAKFSKYASSGELNFVADEIGPIIDAVEKQYTPQAAQIDHLDGLSVWYNNYWFNMRSSKTEPLMRINIEADNEKILTKIKEELVNFVTNLGAKAK